MTVITTLRDVPLAAENPEVALHYKASKAIVEILNECEAERTAYEQRHNFQEPKSPDGSGIAMLVAVLLALIQSMKSDDQPVSLMLALKLLADQGAPTRELACKILHAASITLANESDITHELTGEQAAEMLLNDPRFALAKTH